MSFLEQDTIKGLTNVPSILSLKVIPDILSTWLQINETLLLVFFFFTGQTPTFWKSSLFSTYLLDMFSDKVQECLVIARRLACETTGNAKDGML